jgi:hypothetical protein
VRAPRQAPVQRTNRQPLAALARRVTLWPSKKTAEQVRPQLIPPGALETEPRPERLTVTRAASLNVAVAVFAVSIVTRQSRARPAHALTSLRSGCRPRARR